MEEESRDDEVMTTTEVAKAYSVTPVTIGRWARAGILPVAFRTLGGQRRYRRGDVRRLLEQTWQERQPPEARHDEEGGR